MMENCTIFSSDFICIHQIGNINYSGMIQKVFRNSLGILTEYLTAISSESQHLQILSRISPELFEK